MARVISVRLSDELLSKLDKLVTATERSRSNVVANAIARFVEEETPHVMAIREALDEYLSGNSVGIPHEQVVAEMEEKRRARTRNASRLA